MAIQMEVWGDYACFTRPESKVERLSYDVPTPSAARGMVEAIYYHPGLRWCIDRIHILNPIQFTNLRRNEVKSKALAPQLRRAMGGSGPLPHIDASEDIQQRASTLLQDVHYVIEAHFDMVPQQASPGDNPGKFQDIVKRRLRRGQAFSQPYLGCREFPAHFRLWEGGPIPAIDESRELGWMLFDMDYTDPSDLKPIFFHARLEKGVLDVANCGVSR